MTHKTHIKENKKKKITQAKFYMATIKKATTKNCFIYHKKVLNKLTKKNYYK